MNNNLQEISDELLKLAEDQIIRVQFSVKKLDYIFRNYFYPSFFLYKGFSLFYKNLRNLHWVLVITFTILFIYFCFLLPSAAAYRSIIIPSTVISLSIVMFAVPSSLSEIVVCVPTMEKLKKILIRRKINSIDEVEMIEKAISFNKELSNKRVNFFKWAVGFVWATYLLYLNFVLKIMGLTGEFDLQSWWDDISKGLLILVLISMVFTISVALYSKTCDIIYKNIELSLNQYKFELIGRNTFHCSSN